MKLDIKEIVSAWMISFNPSEEEKVLAEKRYEVCSGCDKRGLNKLGIEVCKACGCPLSKKIFTLKDQESCPLKKWDNVNQEFRKIKTSKYKLL
jgi:hypothetical protein